MIGEAGWNFGGGASLGPLGAETGTLSIAV
jgi:hypothetical protein